MNLVPTRIPYRRGTLVFVWLLTVRALLALSPDPRILPFVLPGSQLVAGMRAPTLPGKPGSFLLITHNNSVDLEDFFAITGSDPSRRTYQVIFTDSADDHGNLIEHSILVSGHFDRGKIFRSMSAKPIQYRRVAILVVFPFERERNVSNRLRWFTVIDSDAVLFGTVASVQRELDRYLAGSESDASLVQKLIRLRQDDDTWCLLSTARQSEEISRVLGMLDPELAESVQQGGSLQFGIRTGRQVEFEYEITTSSGSDEAISTSFAKSLAGRNTKASSRLPRINSADGESHLHGVVKVSRLRYEAWLAEASARGKSAAPPH